MEIDFLYQKHLTSKKFKKNLKNEIPMVIFLLDNHNQISDLNDIFSSLKEQGSKFPPMFLFHDEGDVITKSDNTLEKDGEQAKSHQEWINMKDFCIRNQIPLFRFLLLQLQIMF